MRTSAASLWRSATSPQAWQLKHVANAEARVAFWNIATGSVPTTPPHDRLLGGAGGGVQPPQMASVGLTEAGCIAAGLDIAVGRRDYAGTAYGWALVDETSFAKVIVDRATGLVLGAHVLGPQAATLIQPLVAAIQFGQSAEQVARGQYWIHPALTEVVENALLDALEQI